MQVYITLVLLYWKLVPSAAAESSDFPSEKYQSYLQFPRISFGGRFKANVATGNNVPKNFDNDNFFHYDRFGTFQGGKNEWNSEGTNDFLLMDCYVTSACHLDGRCTDEASVDKICGNSLTDSEFSSFAKIVDVDTAFQLVPEIWGMKLRVPGFFRGELRPSPLHFYWKRGTGTDDSGYSGIYHSTVRNITWEAGANSSLVLKQMQDRMQYLESVELSITYILDAYHVEGSKDFAIGRILGVIGISGPLAPQVSVWGRSLAPLFPVSEQSKDSTANGTVVHTNHAPFVIDEEKRKLHICLLNSLCTKKDGIPINFPNGTKVGYFLRTKEMRHFLFPSGSCKESVVAIADISLMNMTNVMLKFGGVVDIDLTEEQVQVLRYTSLSVFQSIGENCSNVFMQEYKDGLRVRSYENWLYRLENGQQISHKLFVTKFGKPAQDINISIVPSEEGFDTTVESTGYQEPRPFKKLNKATDRNGFANFVFPTRSSNHYIRKGIDGNIEGYAYAIVNSSMSILSRNVLDRFIIARVFHNHSYPNEPTWTDHVLPIFQQYANMFPCMRNRGFDLSNYFDVVDHKEILRLSMSLPIGHPSYMPATRDLSQVKKEMILRWLSKDIPPYGDARKLLTKHYLLGLLQTALEATHATIPPLLTALWSIKKGYNRNIRKTLIQLINQNKYKIHTISRIMLSLGGRPKMFHGSFVLSYPSSLPIGIDKDQILSLEMLSVSLLHNGIAITRPETSKIFLWFKKAIFTHAAANRGCHHQCKWRSSKCCRYWSYLRRHKERHKKRCRSAVSTLLKASLQNLKPEKSYNPYEDPQQRKIFNFHSSVDNFYHHILAVLSFITNCGSNNTIFHQVNLKSAKYRNLKSYDYFSAVDDLRHIMRITNSIDGESQHNLFSSIVDDICKPSSSRSCNQFSRGAKRAPNTILDNLTPKSYHSHNDAPPYSIWSILANMKTIMYPNGNGRDLVRAFNDVYTFYLIAYEKMLNALTAESRNKHRSILKELERAFHVIGHRIVQTPLNKYANKHSGPNMAPTFEVDFEIARTGFLEKRLIIDKLKSANWNLGRYNQMRKQYMRRKPGDSFPKQTDIVFQDDAGQQLSDTDGVYQPLYKNPYIDLYAKYNDLPIR